MSELMATGLTVPLILLGGVAISIAVTLVVVVLAGRSNFFGDGEEEDEDEEDIQHKCDHVYQHIKTVRWLKKDGGYHRQWIRVDEFACTRCPEIREVRKEEWSRESPDWYWKRKVDQ